ncbi:hypothetical protein Dsin_005604 [Dipteronia sinensis]|uniref:Uncharacterized protein n=1 Tax=Dipteronia sinensis TaxID=43782 RepID=A0AAE0EFD2_9ROSI|nr:hypothetical protein Dsin_005604 [Dipteronia sinensis]
MSTEENTETPSSSVNDKGCKKRKGMGQNQYYYNKITKAKESGVPINDLGQPHGESSKPLSTSYGLIVTQLIPITYDSWPNVPRDYEKQCVGDYKANISDIAEWNKFVKFRLSPEFSEISRKYGELAKKNETPHTTSRKGLARLREELRVAKIAKNEDPDEVDRVEIWIAGHKHKDGTPVNENVENKIER